MNVYETADGLIIGYVDASPSDLAAERPPEECGIVGVYLPESNMPVEYSAAELAWHGLARLQNRGQDAAGIYVAGHDGAFIGEKGLGMLPDALPFQRAVRLDETGSRLAVGHVRWSTSSSSGLEGAQPFMRDKITLAHNGHAEGVDDMAKIFGIDVPEGVSDSDKLSIALNEATRRFGSIDIAMRMLLPYLDGAYCLSVSDGENLYGVRDFWGYHPLIVGELPGGGCMLASESTALDAAGVAADKRRDVEPGEVVRIGPDGATYERLDRIETLSECTMEYIYLAHPDSVVNGVSVRQARYNMGLLMGRAAQLEVDVVSGVPESGRLSGQGLADGLGVPYTDALVRNEGIERTFIEQDGVRELKLQQKFTLDPDKVRGLRVAASDDSIVRGSTMRVLSRMFELAGVREFHAVSVAPPSKYACFMGQATGDPRTLIANGKSSQQVAVSLRAKSATYNTPEIIDKAVNMAADESRRQVGRICTSCVTGKYPMRVPGQPQQTVLGMPGLRRADELQRAG